MEPSPYSISCGALDLGAWYNWIGSWRAANQPIGFDAFPEDKLRMLLDRTALDERVANRPLELNDLTGDALRAIIDRTSLEDRAVLRNTSHRFRALVDATPIECKALKISWAPGLLKLSIGDEDVMDKKFYLEESYTQILMHMGLFLRMPSLRLDILSFEFPRGSFYQKELLDLLKRFLASINCQIHTKTAVINSGSPKFLMQLLKKCKPGYLKRIECPHNSVYIDDYVKKHQLWPYCGAILQLEQWKKAVELSVSQEMDEAMKRLDKDCFAHFKEVTVATNQF